MRAMFRSAAAAGALVTIVCAGFTPAGAQTRQAFRLTSLGLADPQIFLPALGQPCVGPLNIAVNGLINSAINECTPVTEGVPDPCAFDFNIAAVFDPLIQSAGADPAAIVPCMSQGASCSLEFAVISECIRSAGAVSCNGEPSTVIPTTYSNGGATATCLGALPGTIGPGNNGTNPSVVAATGNATNNCGVSGILELTLNLGDGLITIPLKGAQLGARYSGNPATGLTTGLARGFLSETDADAIMIDVNMPPFVIDAPLSELLPGGTNNCRTAATQQDDRDTNPPDSMDGERGWWFYLTFAANLVTAAPFPTATATETMAAEPTDTPQPTDTPVPTDTPAPTDTPLPTSTPLPTDTPPTSTCPGDCNGDGQVPINEVQLSANIYLEAAPVSACPAADRNGSQSVEINEVVQAANSFQFDCP